MATLANTLKSTRERRGWSREALAYHAGMSAAAIAQIETGRRRDIRLSSLSALAKALRVSVDYLIGAHSTTVAAPLEHRALIYGSDTAFLAAAAPYLREGVERAESPLAVTGTVQIDLLRRALGAHAEQIEFADSARWYSTPRAALDRYRAAIDLRLAAGCAWIRILGEPVWSARSARQAEQWIRYESLINLTFASAPATLVCPYDTRRTPRHIIEGAHRTHPGLGCTEDPVVSPAYHEPEDFLIEAGKP